MRGSQVTNQTVLTNRRRVDYLCNGHNILVKRRDESVISATLPKFVKGRGNLVNGPKPLPTPYFGFEVTTIVTPGQNFWLGGQSYFNTGHTPRYEYATENVTDTKTDNKQLSDLIGLYFGITTEANSDKAGSGTKLLPSVSSETVGRARTGANNKLRSDTINFGQSLGELPELLTEVKRFVGSIIRIIVALKKGNIPKAHYHLGTLLGKKRALDLVRGISDAYLFYRFGVVPVLNDLNHMIEEIYVAVNKPLRFKVKHTATNVVPPPYSSSMSLYTSSGSMLEVCEVGYTVRPNEDYKYAFLGLTNPLGTLWELVPLSFVINWFVSIGDVLNALDAGVGLEFESGYETTVVKGTISYTKTATQGWFVPAKFQCDAFGMQRKVLSGPAFPPLYIKTSIFRSKGKLVTLTALLVSFGAADFLAPGIKRLKGY